MVDKWPFDSSRTLNCIIQNWKEAEQEWAYEDNGYTQVPFNIEQVCRELDSDYEKLLQQRNLCKTKGCQRQAPKKPDLSWIVWQQACSAMRQEILRELRAYFKENPVATHVDIDALICETHDPSQEAIGDE